MKEKKKSIPNHDSKIRKQSYHLHEQCFLLLWDMNLVMHHRGFSGQRNQCELSNLQTYNNLGKLEALMLCYELMFCNNRRICFVF